LKGIAAGLVVAVLGTGIVVGCGASEEEKRQKARQEQAAKKRAQERRREAKCALTFRPLQDAIDELDSRLGVGLNYENYTTEVADVRVAYDRTDFDGLKDPVCLTTVGLPLERALNQYVKAANVWDDCFGDFDCDMDDVQPTMQKHWNRASSNASVSSAVLETVGD
jgi:hypothetical protein